MTDIFTRRNVLVTPSTEQAGDRSPVVPYVTEAQIAIALNRNEITDSLLNAIAILPDGRLLTGEIGRAPHLKLAEAMGFDDVEAMVRGGIMRLDTKRVRSDFKPAPFRADRKQDWHYIVLNIGAPPTEAQWERIFMVIGRAAFCDADAMIVIYLPFGEDLVGRFRKLDDFVRFLAEKLHPSHFDAMTRSLSDTLRNGDLRVLNPRFLCPNCGGTALARETFRDLEPFFGPGPRPRPRVPFCHHTYTCSECGAEIPDHLAFPRTSEAIAEARREWMEEFNPRLPSDNASDP